MAFPDLITLSTHLFNIARGLPPTNAGKNNLEPYHAFVAMHHFSPRKCSKSVACHSLAAPVSCSRL